MALTPDNCKAAFVDAMRARLIADDPTLGANVDNDGVQKNLAALGEATRTILTADAEVLSNAAADPAFWPWMAAVNTWLGKISTWQQGVTSAVNAWAPTLPADQAFRTALLNLAAPGAPPAPAPTSLKGKIQ